jgi:hypothetical protein
MTIDEFFESLMLCCFSVGWYWSIFRMLMTGQPYGKSSAFVAFTVTGYMLGLSAKMSIWLNGGELSSLVLLYGWNLVVTTFDLALVIRYGRKTEAAPTGRTLAMVVEKHSVQRDFNIRELEFRRLDQSGMGNSHGV